MIYPALMVLLSAAALCFGLGRLVATRLLGLGAALAALLAALLSGREAPLQPAYVLLELHQLSLHLTPQLATSERVLALVTLGGGSAALLALAGAVAPTVRGFGALFAWALLSLAAALFSLGTDPLSLAQPVAWALLAITGYGALRSSGTLKTETSAPLGLSVGLLASLLLAGGLLASSPQVVAEQLSLGPAALLGFVAALLLAGGPPLALARREAEDAPAALGALIYGVAAPAAALAWLLRSVPLLPELPSAWSNGLGLVGSLGFLACGAAALGSPQLRVLLSWVGAGQVALVVAALSVPGPLAALAGPGILVGMLLAGVAAAVAVARFEQTTGSDNYTTGTGGGHALTGALWAFGALALLGLPPLWGFWPRLWLLEALLAARPWMLAPLMAGFVLTSLALLAPLGRLWASQQEGSPALTTSWAALGAALFVGLPLLGLGVRPTLVWDHWLQHVTAAPDVFPLAMNNYTAGLLAGVFLLLAGITLIRARPERTVQLDPDEHLVTLSPAALGAALRPLAGLSDLRELLNRLWHWLTQLSEWLRLLMSLMEQRYYLLGVLGALITIMLLMAQ
ncbi:MAG: hypothetical protein EI684_05160 [Candidatus Viridilinea halotolerans]|uniref:NADH:quinone oxidoreductase/Mrp antiporter transmembrane domain-containing protein n=1 Tax=Candidatus Viridilinea halotolerans TaxID=2491704 RepID=A0A426U5M0_9CHLR|nr:MAG: hypothetical protein EI684_05160 [Candidatus Viridilinea halotolerans]